MKKLLKYIFKNIEKIKSHIYTAFYYDLSIKRLIELSFPILITGLYLCNRYYHPIENIKYLVVTTFLSWAGLALIGFFIPTAKEYINFSQGIKNSKPNEIGIPFELKVQSKGGFIAGRKIKIKAKVVNLDNKTNSQDFFRKKFDEFSIVYFNSFKLPIEKGLYMGGSPEAGGIVIDMKTLQGKASIVFNSPGVFFFRTLYQFKGDENMNSQIFNNNEMAKPLCISSPENYISLRNYAITYSLTLIILLLTILQLQIIN